MKYISVRVYSDMNRGLSGLGGVTTQYDKTLVVPVPDGYISEEDVERMAYIVLEPMRPAFDGCPVRFKERGEKRMMMSGGNFVYSSDSRFSREYGAPISVHDRYEG